MKHLTFPLSGFMVVDAKSRPVHKVGHGGVYITKEGVDRCRSWFDFRYANKGPYRIIPVTVTPDVATKEKQ